MTVSCLPTVCRGRQGRASALKYLTSKASCTWIKPSSWCDSKTHLQAYIHSVASLSMDCNKCGFLCYLCTTLYSDRRLRIRLWYSNGLSWWWHFLTGWLYITWVAGDWRNIGSDQLWNDQIIDLTKMLHIWAVALICCLIHELSNSPQLTKQRAIWKSKNSGLAPG